jgi:Kef-type K+ transport system membrane component KefB
MHFFPHFPLHVNPIVLFGITLLLGLLGGEAARMTRILPRISGYIAVGFLAGPSGFNFASRAALADASIFVDIALGLILFDLGRHLDFNWLRHDRGLLPMAILESVLSYSVIFLILYFYGFAWLPSALVATIAAATSPAIVMMVAHDISAEGPITRRSLMLTSLNNLFALIVFTILLPMTHVENTTTKILYAHIFYRLFGSIVLGMIIFMVTIFFSSLAGKKKESQFILFVGAVSVAIGMAISLSLSIMLTLFIFGVAARNFDRKHKLIEVDFGWFGRLFFVILFVVAGVYLKLEGLWQATWIVLAFIACKVLSKMIGVMIFGHVSQLTKQQSFALGLTLVPMAEVAIGMSNRLVLFNPNFSPQLITIVTSVAAILYIIGPIAVQTALIKMGEATASSN